MEKPLMEIEINWYL